MITNSNKQSMKTQIFDKNHNLISEKETRVPTKPSATYIRVKNLKNNQDKPKSEVITTAI